MRHSFCYFFVYLGSVLGPQLLHILKLVIRPSFFDAGSLLLDCSQIQL